MIRSVIAAAWIWAAAIGRLDAQIADGSLASLKSLGRDSLIQRAADLVIARFPEFRIEDFDHVRVFAHRGDLRVRFDQPLKIWPQRGAVIYTLEAELVGGTLAWSTTGEGDDERLHTPTEEYLNIVKFVLGSINRSHEVGHVTDFKLPNGTHMEIEDKGSYYQVRVSSWSTYSTYKVRKRDGDIYDASHKHYARSRQEEEEEDIP